MICPLKALLLETFLAEELTIEPALPTVMEGAALLPIPLNRVVISLDAVRMDHSPTTATPTNQSRSFAVVGLKRTNPEKKTQMPMCHPTAPSDVEKILM